MDWACLGHPLHSALNNYCAALGALYVAHPALHCPGAFAWVWRDEARRAMAFVREAEGQRLLCAFNLGDIPLEENVDAFGCGRAVPLFAAGPVADEPLPARAGQVCPLLPPMSGAVYALE